MIWLQPTGLDHMQHSGNIGLSHNHEKGVDFLQFYRHKPLGKGCLQVNYTKVREFSL